MRFTIPKEHRDTPEAMELVRLDREFNDVLEASVAAMRHGLLESDPKAFARISEREKALLRQIERAEDAYDKALGEPKPINLNPTELSEIGRTFGQADQVEARDVLARTLGYLDRNGPFDRRVSEAMIRVAGGDLHLLHQAAEAAKQDYRDLLC
ncbi:hypothetical protein [Haloferula sp.]|uniref:hypothetical protein n=1 Tax=Haloferula sp. TaxID=2497595 RepID=UPI003C743A04